MRKLYNWGFVGGMILVVEGIREVYPPAALFAVGLVLCVACVNLSKEEGKQ